MAKAIRSVMLPLICVLAVGFLAAEAGQMAAGRNSAKIDKMVKQMLDGRDNHQQIPYLTATFGPLSTEEAYRIQAALTKKLTPILGNVAGYKVAYASKAAQEQFAIDEPAYGTLFSLGRLPSGSKLSSDEILEITLETEVLFTIGKKIDRTIDSVEELKKHIKWVHPAFDIGEYRYTSGEGKPTPQDMIACGIGSHYFALGPAVAPGDIDLDKVNLKLGRNGRTIAESAATNVMGSPWNSLLWLANRIVSHGGELKPGDVVLTGTATPAYKAKAEGIKGSYEGDCGPLGKVTMTIY